MNAEQSTAMLQKSFDVAESVDSLLSNVLYLCSVGYLPEQFDALTSPSLSPAATITTPVGSISPSESPLLPCQQHHIQPTQLSLLPRFHEQHTLMQQSLPLNAAISCAPGAIKLPPSMPPSPLSLPGSPLAMNPACLATPAIKPITAGIMPSPQPATKAAAATATCMEQRCYSMDHFLPQSYAMLPSLSLDSTISSAPSTCDNEPAKFISQYHCLWDGCGREFDVQTDLLRHLSEEHVGRSLRGNLCLTCRWPGCSRVAKKRDHMISHLKSHVPYWPFICKYCNNRFKHATGLNRHVSRHEARGDRL